MRILFFLLIGIITGVENFACTTFFLHKDGQMVFGRNYDWITGSGMVCTNLRAIKKTSMLTEDGKTISWISKYGSTSFNQYGKEFPTGGMNEKGLVVELMWLDETKYPQPDSRPAIGVLQWIQYQLDNCATIEDVIATDKVLRIASVGTTPLHYLVADANGQAAAIEFLDGKMVVHKGNELSMPVLTNSIYKESLNVFKNANSGSNNNSFTYGNNSLQRFQQACSGVQQFRNGKISKPIIEFAFDMLAEVSQGPATRWSIVYDITNKSVHFRTAQFPLVKTVHFSALDFSCPSPVMAFNMNQPGSGDFSSKFQALTLPINQKLVETSFRESVPHINVSPKTQEAVWRYGMAVQCQ